MGKAVRSKIASLGHSCTVDDSNATIGKRYSRNDELGIPFACTVDKDTIDEAGDKFETVTLRERDSMEQVRLPVGDVPSVLHDLCWGRRTWAMVQEKYPNVAKEA